MPSKNSSHESAHRRPLVALALAGALACGCGGSAGGGSTGGGSGGSMGTGGSAGPGSGGSGGTSAGSGGSSTGGSSSEGTTGSGGTTALGGATGSGGTAASGGATGSGGTTSAGGATGSGGAADGGGSGKGGAIGSGGATTGGGGATGTGGSAGAGGGGAANCAGRAISMSANGTSSDSDSALSRVEIDLKTDLPIGNSKRTIEYWAYIKTTDWVGDKNEMYFYGGTVSAGEFGMDFGTNPVAGMSGNHATLDPFTNGGFSDDSTDYLGVTSSINQWVHIAMVWDGTNLLTYVNGQLKITTMGTGGITALATAQSILTIGCNPTNNACFNGFFDEFRVWNVARSATDIQNNYNTPMTGNETGLVGYWKFDEASGTTAADAVTAAGHTAHNGTLKADATAHNPTFVTPPVPLPLVCNRAGN
jgi:hypothetical protein